MDKDLKKSIKELITTIDDEFNNTDNWYISHFMPETRSYQTEEKNFDENGNWGFENRGTRVTEDMALKEAQYCLLNNPDESYFDEFVSTSEIYGKFLNLAKLFLEKKYGKIN